MIIDCEIEAPQFAYGKVRGMLKQRGMFNTSTMIFDPQQRSLLVRLFIGSGDRHRVHFFSLADFKTACVAVYENGKKIEFDFDNIKTETT